MESVPESVGKVRGFLQEEYDRAFRHEHWHVGIVDAPIHAFLEPGPRPDVRWLPPPERGKYFADPFGVTWGKTNYVFFEEFDFQSFKGVISWVRERDGGGFTEPQVAIDLPFHASYPFLVEEHGELYCIPETGQGREVSVYRAVEFPTHWKKTATLLRGFGATDSTIFRHGGGWWLLCT